MALRDIYARHDEVRRRQSRSRRDTEWRSDVAPSLLEILWRRKLTVLATLLLFLAGGVLYIIVTPPQYLA